MNEQDLAHAREWIGRKDEAEDVITSRLADSFRATFAPYLFGNGLLGIHLCLAPEMAEMSALARDGHAEKGGTLPPIPLPRRMWAGGQTRFHAPLRVGDTVKRVMTVTDVALKSGRTGALCFVETQHDFSTARGLAVSETRTAVYREPAAASATPAASAEPASLDWEITPSAALLLRYSAITFNAHRIHYDRDYTVKVENYAGLIVHGPLQATLALNAAATALGKTPSKFECRALAPLFDDGPFHTKANRDGENTVAAWIENASGGRTFSASAG